MPGYFQNMGAGLTLPRQASLSGVLTSLLKYLVEGLAVALVAYVVPQRKLQLADTAAIALTAAATFAILDTYAPAIGDGARLGTGFGVGGNLVGFGREGLEGWAQCKEVDDLDGSRGYFPC
jgi:hypothetical protein